MAQFNRIGFLAAGLLVVLTANITVAQSDTKQSELKIKVSGTTIRVPMPADFVASKAILKTMSNYMVSKTPNNNIHEIFAPKGSSDAKFLKDGLKRHADVQTVRSLNNKMTQTIFDGVKDLLTKQFDQLMKDVLKSLNDGTGASVETQKKVGSGPFVEEDDHYAYLFYSNIKTPDGKSLERVSAACICFVNKNMVMLNVHSDLTGEKDAKWVKETAKNWLKATLAANGED